MLEPFKVNLPGADFEVKIVLTVSSLGGLSSFRSIAVGLCRHLNLAAKEDQDTYQAIRENVLWDSHVFPVVTVESCDFPRGGREFAASRSIPKACGTLK